ncbi:MAG: DUF6029 family protein [bacterium]
MNSGHAAQGAGINRNPVHQPSVGEGVPLSSLRRRALVGLVILAACTLTLPGLAKASGAGSLQAYNLFEYQVGRDPTAEADDLTKLLDQFILDYHLDNLRVGLRAERYRDSLDQQFGAPDYDEITQKYAEWSQPDFSVRIGNGYAILGRGLLFRAFELPGVVRDASFPRARYVESRDLEGVIFNGRRGPFSFTAMTGQPVVEPNLPYGGEDDFLFRRRGTVSGGRFGVELIDGLRCGGSYLATHDIQVAGAEELGAGDVEIRLHRLLPALAGAGLELRFYGEYAGRKWQPFSDGFDSRDGVPHAVYTATELYYGQWGVSFETKRYHQFNLLINDPPNLVPEFSYHLLNRTSHFLLTDDESGFQVSMQGGLPHDWSLHAETARASSRSDDGFRNYSGARRYDLYFLGIESSPLAPVQVTLYGAAGQDGTEGITGHHVGGASVKLSRDDGWSIDGSLEIQRMERRGSAFEPDAKSEFDNAFAALGVSLTSRGTVAIQAEFSNDPLEKDDPFTEDAVESTPRSWWGVAGNVQLDTNHEILLFIGDRRGGTACTSGTCYEVPDFSGIEMRVSSRF